MDVDIDSARSIEGLFSLLSYCFGSLNYKENIDNCWWILLPSQFLMDFYSGVFGRFIQATFTISPDILNFGEKILVDIFQLDQRSNEFAPLHQLLHGIPALQDSQREVMSDVFSSRIPWSAML